MIDITTLNKFWKEVLIAIIAILIVRFILQVIGTIMKLRQSINMKVLGAIDTITAMIMSTAWNYFIRDCQYISPVASWIIFALIVIYMIMGLIIFTIGILNIDMSK